MQCQYCDKDIQEGDDYFEYENEIYCEDCFDENVKECFKRTVYNEEEEF